MKRELIGRFIETATKHRLTRVCVETDDFEIEFELPRIARPAKPVAKVEPIVAAAHSVAESYVRSNLVGYFRATSKELVSGKVLSTDTVVGTVEALGLNNELLAGTSGRVIEVLVSDGQAVEYGQPIAKVEV